MSNPEVVILWFGHYVKLASKRSLVQLVSLAYLILAERLENGERTSLTSLAENLLTNTSTTHLSTCYNLFVLDIEKQRVKMTSFYL